MLTALFLSLADQFSVFNIFRYLTFRGICGILTALWIGIALGGWLIRKLQKWEIGQVIREDDVPFHSKKKGTPTMGGLLVVVAVTISTLLWADLSTRFVWITIAAVLAFAAIGFADDYLKLKRGNSIGLTPIQKITGQILAALLVSGVLYQTATTPAETAYILPFFKDVSLLLGLWFIPITIFVMVGTSNAVNLTDGLDGLAIMPVVLVAGGLGIFAYCTGHIQFSEYLAIPHVTGAGELVVFCAALVGAGLAFLYFNCYPAQIFMGDVGSMSLGAALAVVAVIVRQEVVFLVMSGIFVLETVSVIMQVISFKLLGRRVWLMSPLHHHFELKGWPEPRITVRFWIGALVLVLAGLATLKIR